MCTQPSGVILWLTQAIPTNGERERRFKSTRQDGHSSKSMVMANRVSHFISPGQQETTDTGETLGSENFPQFPYLHSLLCWLGHLGLLSHKLSMQSRPFSLHSLQGNYLFTSFPPVYQPLPPRPSSQLPKSLLWSAISHAEPSLLPSFMSVLGILLSQPELSSSRTFPVTPGTC